MDITQHLILIKIKENWIDKTNEIASITLNGNLYLVSFNKSSQIYKYSKSKLILITQEGTIDLSDNIIRINGKNISRWGSAVYFGDYVRLFSETKQQLIKRKNLEILPDLAKESGTKDIIEYYYELARLVGNNNEKSSYISKFYQDKLGDLQPESVANAFLTGGVNHCENIKDVALFPFGINPSQRDAVNASLTSQVSLIQGPPGTGKTQTILNIISNLIVRGKKIAIVAGNNSAVANVYEKLKEEGFGFIVANLGSSMRQAEFFESDYKLPDITNWKLNKDQILEHENNLKETSDKIAKLLEDKNRLAIFKESYNRLKIEKLHFTKHFDVSPIGMHKYSIFNIWISSDILSFMAELKQQTQSSKLSLFTKLKWLFKYRIYKFSEFERLDNDCFKKIVNEYYHKRSVELISKINDLEESLIKDDFDTLLSALKDNSSLIFKHYLAKKYESEAEVTFSKFNYKSNFTEFSNRFPIVLSTTDSIINNKDNATLFDYIIVDEASQVNLLTGFLTMACTKNIVVVGDLKQLPHIADESLDPYIDTHFKLPPAYSYFEKSLLASLVEIFPDCPNTLLKEHYRCHPQIIDFCNQKYYNGQLITMTTGTGQPFKIIKTVEGNHARLPSTGSGFINVRELDVIRNEVIDGELLNHDLDDLGIISPYRAQVEIVSERIGIADLTADTVHKFQGREKESIIFTTTANTLTQFMDNPNLLNVAVSRAKNRFVLVTSPNVLKKHGSNIGDLIRHIEYQSLDTCIVESKTISIFDCLYKEYSKTLTAFRAKVGNQSEFLSENLMAALLDEVIEMDLYNSFYYQRDYPLSLLINDHEILDVEEKKFALDSPSHIDFIIYNKLDMQPVLTIEIDGYSYHALNEQQKKRDACKNGILEKLSLPLLRLSTVESHEKERVLAELDKFVI